MIENYYSLDLHNVVQFLFSCNAVTLNVTTSTIFPWGGKYGKVWNANTKLATGKNNSYSRK